MKKKAIAILTTILISIPTFMDTPFAEAHGPNNIVYTPYGTCTSEFYYDSANSTHNITLGGVTIPQVGPVNLLRYTFTHPYTGTFDLDITISGVLSNIWELMTSNCYLVSVVDETTLRFAVNNAEYCEIAIMPSQYNNRLVFWLENQNLTPVEDTTTAVNDILSHVTYMDGQLQQTQANTLAIRNVLMSMSGYSADSSDNIATDMDTLINIMNQLNTKIDNLDIIQWQKVTTLQGITNNFVNYSLAGQVYDPSYSPVYQQIFFNQNSYKGLFKMVFNITAYADKQYYLYAKNGSNYIMIEDAVVYKEYNRDNVIYYVKFDAVQRFQGNVQFFLDATENFYYYGDTESACYFIGYDNVDYWRLLDYFESKKHSNLLDKWGQAIVNAINAMSLNVNQLTVNATGITYNVNNTQVNNSVNTYNTDIQNVYNVENDFSTSFNQYNQQFTPDFTETMTTIQSVPNVMNNIVVDLYNLPFIKYPLLLTLAGIVLIALLGV